MSTITAQTAATEGALRSQALFESITGPEHKTDLTRPEHKSPDAAERATWRKVAA